MFKNGHPLYVVYMITSTVSGKSYIGKTIQGLKKRWQKHVSLSKKIQKTHFCKAIHKYGEDCWKHELLYVTFEKDDDHLYDVETQLIADFNTLRSGYNESAGGRGCKSGIHHPCYGRIQPPEEKAAQIRAQIGKVIPLAQREASKLRMLGKQHTLGYKHTEEQLTLRISSKPSIVNTSGITGVGLYKGGSKWRARIKVKTVEKYLGSFTNKNDAIIARLMAELKYYGLIKTYDY